MNDARYLALFVAEAREHLVDAERILAEHHDRLPAADDEGLDALFRHAHSLKGMAATLDVRDLTRVAHAFEDVLEALRSGAATVDDLPVEIGWETLACMNRLVDAVARSRAPRDGQAGPLARRLRAAAGLDPEGSPDSDHPGRERRSAETGSTGRRVRVAVALDPGRTGSLPVLAVMKTLARLGKIEHVEPWSAREASERGTARITAVIRTLHADAHVASEVEAVSGVGEVAVEAAPERARRCPRPVGPMSFLRVRASDADALLSAASELLLAHQELLRAVPPDPDPELARELRRCRALARRVHARISDVRLVPFETIAPRLTVVANDAAARTGKLVRVEIEGREVGMDRSMLDALGDPMVQLVRNAVAHGIEPVEARIDAGKPGPGTVRVAVARSRDRLRIEVRDDGAGVDVDALERAGADRGADLFDMIAGPGVSTASAVDELSGRGFGMDVVRRAIDRIGGRISVSSITGRGTAFVIDLPGSQAVIQSLLIRTSGELLAVPLSAVERTCVMLDDGRAPGSDRASSLAARLGLAGSPTGGDVALVARGGGQRAWRVDEIVGRRELLVRPLAPPLRAMPGYTGAAMLEGGDVVLVLDPRVLD